MPTLVYHNNTPLIKTIDVLWTLDRCMNTKKPFGLVRFGDGTIKAINSFYEDNMIDLTKISKQEGIPIQHFPRIIQFWKTSANICDYIDCPEVYFSNKFWNRTKSIKKKHMSSLTISRLKDWRKLYDSLGITNTTYCNPEINFLSCIIGKYGIRCLPDLLHTKKICLITSRTDIPETLKFFPNLDVLEIFGKEENQYQNSFNKVINKIDNDATKYDIWLIAAGELGRVYPGLIKFKGGRAFDIGSLVDFWCTGEIPSRLKPYLQATPHHQLKLTFTQEGKEFSKHI